MLLRHEARRHACLTVQVISIWRIKHFVFVELLNIREEKGFNDLSEPEKKSTREMKSATIYNFVFVASLSRRTADILQHIEVQLNETSCWLFATFGSTRPLSSCVESFRRWLLQLFFAGV